MTIGIKPPLIPVAGIAASSMAGAAAGDPTANGAAATGDAASESAYAPAPPPPAFLVHRPSHRSAAAPLAASASPEELQRRRPWELPAIEWAPEADHFTGIFQVYFRGHERGVTSILESTEYEGLFLVHAATGIVRSLWNQPVPVLLAETILELTRIGANLIPMPEFWVSYATTIIHEITFASAQTLDPTWTALESQPSPAALATVNIRLEPDGKPQP